MTLLRLGASIGAGLVPPLGDPREDRRHPSPERAFCGAARDRADRALDLHLRLAARYQAAQAVPRHSHKGESRHALARAVFLHQLGEPAQPRRRNDGLPRLGSQPPRQRDNPVEHRLSQPRRPLRARPRRAHSRRAPRPGRAATLEPHHAHRRLSIERDSPPPSNNTARSAPTASIPRTSRFVWQRFDKERAALCRRTCALRKERSPELSTTASATGPPSHYLPKYRNQRIRITVPCG